MSKDLCSILCQPFFGPLVVILDFAVGERTPPAPLGLYSLSFSHLENKSKAGMTHNNNGKCWFQKMRSYLLLKLHSFSNNVMRHAHIAMLETKNVYAD